MGDFAGGVLCFSVDTEDEALLLLRLVGRQDLNGYALVFKIKDFPLEGIVGYLERAYERLRRVRRCLDKDVEKQNVRPSQWEKEIVDEDR